MDSGFYAVDRGWQKLDPVLLVREPWFQIPIQFRASYIEQAPAVKKVDNAIHGINPYPVDSATAPLQRYVVQRGTKTALLEKKSCIGTRQTKKITV